MQWRAVNEQRCICRCNHWQGWERWGCLGGLVDVELLTYNFKGLQWTLKVSFWEVRFSEIAKSWELGIEASGCYRLEGAPLWPWFQFRIFFQLWVRSLFITMHSTSLSALKLIAALKVVFKSFSTETIAALKVVFKWVRMVYKDKYNSKYGNEMHIWGIYFILSFHFINIVLTWYYSS